MKRITLSKLKQAVILPETPFKATIKWVAREKGHAILRLSTDIGIACVLNISKDVRGSIFDFMYKGMGLELIIENVVSCDDEITQMIFLLG